MSLVWNDIVKVFRNFQRNNEYILITVILIFSGLLLMGILGINLNPTKTHNIKKIVTVETDGTDRKYNVQKLNGKLPNINGTDISE
jgi:hypothetical protein